MKNSKFVKNMLNMKKLSFFLSLVLIAFGAAAQDTIPENAQIEFKSAIIKGETTVMGQVSQTEEYVDDYGNKILAITTVSVPLMGEVKSGNLILGDVSYIINYRTNKVQKTEAPESVNYLHLDEDTIKKFNIKEEGTETVLGRECKKMSLNLEAQGTSVPATIWVWKGIPLKTIYQLGEGMEMVTNVTDIQTDVEIDPSKFEVPGKKK